MPKYTVRSHIRHDGQAYQPGDKIELMKAQALVLRESLIDDGELAEEAATLAPPRVGADDDPDTDAAQAKSASKARR